MKDNQTKPLHVVLHGMDTRTYKTMVMYFQSSCKGAAVVVEQPDGEVDIVDVDLAEGKTALEKLLAKPTSRPMIVLSREETSLKNVLYVEKPVHLAQMLSVLEQARQMLKLPAAKKAGIFDTEKVPTLPVIEKNASGESIEYKKTAKHTTAMQLDERSFSPFIGIIHELDVTDETQLINAAYNPKDYFQGYVLAAVKISKEKNRMLQLNSNWKPLLIFPHSHEVWLDADDKQLRAFAALEMSKATGSKLTITPINPASTEIAGKLDKFYDLDAFIWKLAVWTSKGRYPKMLDIHRPVFIKHWPNFTRSLVTPHALRITALLIKEPQTMLNIAQSLKIKPQYVFVFMSAAYALNLIGQIERKADEPVVAPSLEPQKPPAKGLLNKILGKLRGIR